MDSETARLIFVSIMSVGSVVWLWSLMKALRLGQTNAGIVGGFVEETGEMIVHGEPAAISKSLVNSFSTLGLGMFVSLYKITEQSAKRIAVEKVGPLICNQPTGLYFSEAEFTFESAGLGSTKVSYCLGYKRINRLLRKIAIALVLGIGLPVMLIVGYVVWFFVVQSDQPSIRWQVFQALQIVHALWPPFLIMWAYAQGKRQSKVFVENLIMSVESSE